MTILLTRKMAQKVFYDGVFGWSKPEKECHDGWRNSYKCGDCDVTWSDRDKESACWSCGKFYSTWGIKIEV